MDHLANLVNRASKVNRVNRESLALKGAIHVAATTTTRAGSMIEPVGLMQASAA
jgi:hypothetical protein